MLAEIRETLNNLILKVCATDNVLICMISSHAYILMCRSYLLLLALLLQSPQEWHTQVALPFVKIGAFDCTNIQYTPNSTHAFAHMCTVAVCSKWGLRWNGMRFASM